MRKIAIFSVLALAALSSCKKDLTEGYTPAPLANQAKATKFNEIKTNASFDWSNEKKIDFRLNGLKTEAVINRTLSVSSGDGKMVFLKVNHQMNLDLITKLNVPAPIKDIKITYGTIEKTMPLNGNQVTFDFITETTAE